MKVDATGTGESFVDAQIVANGDAVDTIHRATYLRTDSCPLGTYERRDATADLQAPRQHQMRWW